MWILFVIATFLFAPAAYAQSITVFGNSDAQQCFFYTKLPLGSSGLEYCDKALRFGVLSKRDKAATLVNRGINLNHARRFDDAMADYESALNLNPELAEAFVNRGNTFIFIKQFELARTDYTRAIELETRDLHAAYYNRGLAHEALRDLDSAFADYVEAIRLKPEWDRALERVARYEANGYKRIN